MSVTSFLKKIATRSQSGGSTGETTPPVLGSPQRLSQGIFQFKFAATPGAEFDVQATGDFKTWISIDKGIASNEATEVVDRHVSNFNCRFYRVVTGEIASVNVLGCVSLTLPPGFSLIANPLDSEINTVSALFKNWPDGTKFSKFNTRMFRLGENSIRNGAWTDPSETFAPGEGAIFFNPTTDYKFHCFVGQVMQGKHSLPLPSGFLICSSMVPQRGSLQEDLGFPIAQGDVVHLFDPENQKYSIYPFGANGWEAGQPVIGLAEAFWVAKTAAANWTREFFIG